MDVDHVDPQVFDQVRLPTGEHREPVTRIMSELFRANVDRPGLAHPPAPRVLRREDDDLVTVRLELPARRQDGRPDAVDGAAIAVRAPSNPRDFNDPGTAVRTVSRRRLCAAS